MIDARSFCIELEGVGAARALRLGRVAELFRADLAALAHVGRCFLLGQDLRLGSFVLLIGLVDIQGGCLALDVHFESLARAFVAGPDVEVLRVLRLQL